MASVTVTVAAGASSKTVSDNILVDVSKNKIVTIISDALVYEKSATLRTDQVKYIRV
jgi:hypothetical protein